MIIITYYKMCQGGSDNKNPMMKITVREAT